MPLLFAFLGIMNPFLRRKNRVRRSEDFCKAKIEWSLERVKISGTATAVEILRRAEYPRIRHPKRMPLLFAFLGITNPFLRSKNRVRRSEDFCKAKIEWSLERVKISGTATAVEILRRAEYPRIRHPKRMPLLFAFLGITNPFLRSKNRVRRSEDFCKAKIE